MPFTGKRAAGHWLRKGGNQWLRRALLRVVYIVAQGTLVFFTLTVVIVVGGRGRPG